MGKAKKALAHCAMHLGEVAEERDALRQYQQDFYSAQAEGAKAQARVVELEEMLRVAHLANASLAEDRDEAADRIDHLERCLRDESELFRLLKEEHEGLEQQLRDWPYMSVAERQRDAPIASNAAAIAILTAHAEHLEEEMKRLRFERGDTEEMPVISEDAEYGLAYARGDRLSTGTLHPSDPLVAEVLADKRPSWHGVTPSYKSAIEVPKVGKDEGEGRIIAWMRVDELQPGMRFRLKDSESFEELRSIQHDVTSESIFDAEGTVRLQVLWGGSGYFAPDRMVQVDVTDGWSIKLTDEDD